MADIGIHNVKRVAVHTDYWGPDKQSHREPYYSQKIAITVQHPLTGEEETSDVITLFTEGEDAQLAGEPAPAFEALPLTVSSMEPGRCYDVPEHVNGPTFLPSRGTVVVTNVIKDSDTIYAVEGYWFDTLLDRDGRDYVRDCASRGSEPGEFRTIGLISSRTVVRR